MEFTTTPAPAQTVDFTLDGERYTFTAPKSAILALGMMQGENNVLKATFDWLDAGLGEEQSTRLMGRLSDPADALDLEQVGEVARWLVEQTTGRPTESPQGSASRSAATGQPSAGGASPAAATPRRLTSAGWQTSPTTG